MILENLRRPAYSAQNFDGRGVQFHPESIASQQGHVVAKFVALEEVSGHEYPRSDCSCVRGKIFRKK